MDPVRDLFPILSPVGWNCAVDPGHLDRILDGERK